MLYNNSMILVHKVNCVLSMLLFYYTAPTEVPGNVSVTVESSSSIMLTWERPSPERENGLLLLYHVIIIETQIHYTDDEAEITGMQTYLNRTFNISEERSQLIDMLHPDYNYTVRIAAATEPGIGPFSDAITVRTNMDGEFYSCKYKRILHLNQTLIN